MEWIKISDKKPPFGVGILISNGHIVACAEAEEIRNGVIYYHGHEVDGYDLQWNFDFESITHWAELPKPPCH